MKSVEFNFQLKQCGLYKAPPFQVRWGNRNLFYNGYIVCTQKNIWIHVSCQASFGIFNKRGKLSFLQGKPPMQTSTAHQLSPLLLSKCQQTTHNTYLFTQRKPDCWETQAQHLSPLVLFITLRKWLWIGPLDGEFSSAEMCWDPIKCAALFQASWGCLERCVRLCLDLMHSLSQSVGNR